MNFFRYELQKTFLNKKIWMSCLLVLIFYIIGGYDNFRFDFVDYAELFIYSQRDGTASFISLLFPLVVTFPYSLSYIYESKYGYSNIIILKTGKYFYCLTKLVVNAIISSFIMFFPGFIYLVILLLTKGAAITEYEVVDVILFTTLYKAKPLSYIILLLFNSALCGIIFSTIAMAVSTVLQNIYIVWIFPFLFYITTAFLFERTGYLNAVNLFTLGYLGDYSLLSILIYDCILLFGSIGLFIKGVSCDGE